MSRIFVNVTQGNGTAWVDKPYPYDGEIVTLYAYAYGESQLYDITATDSWDHPIALSVTPVQQFSFNEAWNNMYIEVQFTGETPPEPPEPPFYVRYLWLLCRAARNWRDKR